MERTYLKLDFIRSDPDQVFFQGGIAGSTPTGSATLACIEWELEVLPTFIPNYQPK